MQLVTPEHTMLADALVEPFQRLLSARRARHAPLTDEVVMIDAEDESIAVTMRDEAIRQCAVRNHDPMCRLMAEAIAKYPGRVIVIVSQAGGLTLASAFTVSEMERLARIDTEPAVLLS